MFPFADECSPVTSLSFEWTSYNFTSLQVSWQPESAPQGGLVRYTVHYSPITSNTVACQTTSAQTTDTTIIISRLNPELFYSVSVAVDVQDASPSGRSVYMKCNLDIHNCTINHVLCIIMHDLLILSVCIYMSQLFPRSYLAFYACTTFLAFHCHNSSYKLIVSFFACYMYSCKCSPWSWHFLWWTSGWYCGHSAL